DEAKQSQKDAEQSARAASEAKAVAEHSLEAEQKATDELEAQTEALKQSEEAARRSEERATRAKEQAQQAQKRAETEEARAKQSAAEASRNAEIAKDNADAARAAETSATKALERGELMRRGMAAYRHEEYTSAVNSFAELRDRLRQLDPDPSAKPGDARRKYAEELGWTLSNLAAALQQIGRSDEAAEHYEAAMPILEQTRTADGMGEDDAVLLNAYHGVARTYHLIATDEQSNSNQSAAARNDPKAYEVAAESARRADEAFRKAETFYVKGLDFVRTLEKETAGEVDAPWQVGAKEVAEGHLNLARLYADSGRFPEAEKNFLAVVELFRFRPRPGEQLNPELSNLLRARLTPPLRELAEFYQEKQGRYDDALRVYNEMLALWEGGQFAETLRDDWQQLADIYSNLAQIYALKGERQKVQDAFEAANLLQRAALKFRLLKRVKDPEKEAGENSATLKELDADLEKLGDAFVRLGKLGPAEQLYLEALQHRQWLDAASPTKTSANRFESYYKLSTFYFQHKKDYAEAERYKQLLKEAYASEPRLGLQYAQAQTQLAQTYARDPSKTAEAVQAYEDALAIYAAQNRWGEQNRILYRLDELHRKQGDRPERERAIRRRFEVLAAALREFTGPGKDRSKVPLVLVTEYLNAAERAGLVYARYKKEEKAEAALRRAYDAYDFIVASGNAKVSQNPHVL
ncbi:MAG TPA: hypothetical protein VGV38_03390, partial [Pyrinomonadaceae bacterium]|nr:hypothetical protein [Pyrinomonadaceae bacterium]